MPRTAPSTVVSHAPYVGALTRAGLLNITAQRSGFAGRIEYQVLTDDNLTAVSVTCHWPRRAESSPAIDTF